MRSVATTLAIVLLLTCGAVAQGFPWNDFKPGTIKSLVEGEAKQVRAGESMFLSASHPQVRAEVIYTGKSRPILSGNRSFINIWAGVFGYGQDYADVYESEYLYKEGDNEYWLPTEIPVSKYFDKELKPNDKMVLFVMAIGANRNKDSIDSVILVEEYQLPQNLPKVVKPDAQ